jgi:hypothetical protein
VTQQEGARLRFRAADWPSALNVGLNDVELSVAGDGRVSYRIRYPRWAGYVLGLGALLGLALIVFLLAFDMRGYIARHAGSMVPGLSAGRTVALAWALAVFWGFVWPWILIVLHKQPLEELMDRIVADVDAAAMREAG